MEENLRIIISGGGTGGHIFPAVSIANAIKEQHPEAEILFVGAEGRMEMQRVPAAGYPIKGLPVAGFDRKNLLKNVSVLFKLVKSQLLARKIIKDFKPHAAVGVVSLSDLMTPWDLIKKRADLSAEGDMVIALYNPRSKKRVTHLDEVRELVLKHRDPKTPVGIVQKAGRPGQHMVISDLENFTKEEIDMQTLVIIGNSQTYVENGRMITPRGYKL